MKSQKTLIHLFHQSQKRKKNKMLSALLIAITLALAGVCIAMVGMFRETTYGRELESYIISRNPQGPGDVERLTVEYQRVQERNYI